MIMKIICQEKKKQLAVLVNFAELILLANGVMDE